MDKVMILVIDGCSPEYLTKETAPNIYRLAENYGFHKIVECVMPSVTNVNHASILSGKWPDETGVIGNYYYNPETGDEGFVEEKGYMKAPTILHKYHEEGKKTALLTVKGKILGVYGSGVDIGINMQSPNYEQLNYYGLDEPPNIQSVKSTKWILKAAYRCIKKDNPDIIYCTTNDFIFHHFAPGEKEATEQIADIDEYIEKIFKLDPKRQIYITADHGMNQKLNIVNMQKISEKAGFDVFCLPPLKDRYIENHIYQEGGMLYVFLNNKSQADGFLDFIKKQPYVEQILTREEAASVYHLPIDKIGDYVLFSSKLSAFGEPEKLVIQTNKSRTHGSVYEREIPLIAVNPKFNPESYSYNKDIVSNILSAE